jgi:hypothetical protein
VSQYNKHKGVLICLINEYLAIQLTENPSGTGFAYFFFFLQASLSNAFVCYNDVCQPQLTYSEFLCRVSTSLIGDRNLPKKRGRPIHLSIQKQNQIQRTLVN